MPPMLSNVLLLHIQISGCQAGGCISNMSLDRGNFYVQHTCFRREREREKIVVPTTVIRSPARTPARSFTFRKIRFGLAQFSKNEVIRRCMWHCDRFCFSLIINGGDSSSLLVTPFHWLFNLCAYVTSYDLGCVDFFFRNGFYFWLWGDAEHFINWFLKWVATQQPRSATSGTNAFVLFYFIFFFSSYMSYVFVLSGGTILWNSIRAHVNDAAGGKSNI